MNTVEVRCAVKSYGKGDDASKVLRNLNMTIAKGSIFGLIGPSGCGKTTLLSCILGMDYLDNGSIKVMGHINAKNKTLMASRRIGYMPQEMALVNELTVKETVYYFGNIFEMDKVKLKERYKMLRQLLELPPDNLRIDNCSGGEQRRVSFASAIIHEPDLLILDEPTVGIDPLLREKIWNFLWNETRTSQLSVIITTHYIDEAQKSDVVGLMRDGVLLAEDSPMNIMERADADRLEDAFVTFCKNDKLGLTKFEEPQILYDNLNDFHHDKQNTQEMETKDVKRKLYRPQILKAIFSKYVTQFARQPGTILFLITIPLIQILITNHVIGNEPTDLNIAVVNEDSFHTNCMNSTYTAHVTNDSCYLEDISCRFIDEFRDDKFNIFFYRASKEAFMDVNKLKIAAILKFDSNFTEAVNHLNEFPQEVDDEYKNFLQSGHIQVQLDFTDMRIAYYMKNKIYSVYKSFAEKMMKTCGLPKSLKNLPMAIDLLNNVNAKDFQMPAIIIMIIFFTASSFTAAVNIDDRKEGFWNRSILAGVRTSEIFVSLIAIAMSLMACIFVLVSLALFFTDIKLKGTLLLLTCFYCLLSWCGVMLGLYLAIVCQSQSFSTSLHICLLNILQFLIGFIWPVEGFHPFVKFLAKMSPLTLSNTAITNIIIRDYGISHPSVLKGFLVLIAWGLVSMFLIFKVLGRKKYSKNT